MAEPNNQQQQGRFNNPLRGAMGPGGGGWLNNTVMIGDNNISIATMILAMAVISLAFGTGWIAVLIDPLVMGAVIVIIAIVVGWNNRGTRLFDWLAMGVVFFIGFTITLWFLTDYMPEKVLETKQKVETGAWSQVLQEAAAVAPPARSDAPLDDLVDSLLSTPDYTYDDTPVPGAVPPAAVTPEPGYGGGVPAVPVAPLSTPLPTATPDPVLPLLADLNRAVAAHDRLNATTIAQRILRLEPNNPQAQSVLAEIKAAEDTLINKQHMPVTATYAMVNGEEGRVLRALRGGSYLVIQQETPNIIALACQKIATIQETDGWLIGEEYRVKWCLLDQFNITKAGQMFTVPGE